ncbi:MAG TPA: primosomal protein N' [Deltaproteobacteria bacterium]|nr:primosomal protein N' [Deltaproteobacteria bacterium]
MEHVIVDVVIFSAIPKPLSYFLPRGTQAAVGCRVVAPVRNTLKVGVVVEVKDSSDPAQGLKPITTVLDEAPCITPEIISLVRWCSRYYHRSLGECMSLAFPPSLRKPLPLPDEAPTRVCLRKTPLGRLGPRQEAILEILAGGVVDLQTLRELLPGCMPSLRSLAKRGYVELTAGEAVVNHEQAPPVCYTRDQDEAIDRITNIMAERRLETIVLHGITGSGKTEVYLACALETLSRNRSVLYLVPEIALTPQTIAMVQRRIPHEVAVFHSGLAPRQRAREFFRVARADVGFVLGTRSAVFAPLCDIGLIIVDEEHDGSYKQADGVPYNARDLAILRAKNHECPVILGSATPSMETFVRARNPASTLVTLSSRIGNATLPTVDIIDMRGSKDPLSPQLIEGIRDTADRGEQSLLFINRRGFASAMICPGCGKVLSCTRCDRSLTYHKARGVGLCHYCGYTLALPEVCPSCGCLDMSPVGLGTERVVEAVASHFSDLRILKMDSDEITTNTKLTLALKAIRNREVDVIIGTQMIAKGHDFDDLTLVGVMHAEQLLYMPDFRAGERTFQQIVQVAGRAGRRKPDTTVMIQTLMPDHPLIRSIASYDYQAMMATEESSRRLAGFPPFAHMARIIVTSQSFEEGRDISGELSSKIAGKGVEILGPAPAPIALLRKHHRWHFIVRASNRNTLHRLMSVLERIPIPHRVQLKIDIDPYSML